ncbi:MAG: glucose 1-dehydrogenase [bacterium]|nr:3-alpha-hydroxysteroid dehydrogenase [Deltaproteobacteria bacterium]MCP4908054.1 glucose 1-dehydrogenase [bacterium]
MNRFEGKVALVSGAGQGMGEVEARALAEEGARVVIGDLREDKGRGLAEEIGEAALFVPLDVTRPESWASAIEETAGRFGRLDVLVNNAGIMRYGPIEGFAFEDYMAVIMVNQVGTFLGMQAAHPVMRDSGGGAIVNISSTAGMQGVAAAVAYVASKHAVRGMTKTAALEFARDGIRVNSIHPGGVETDMARPMLAEREALGDTYESNPIPRIGQPEEVARLVLFLACDDSSYCTGSEFVIDGGGLAGEVHESMMQAGQ